MIVHSFGSDAQSKATELATKILVAASSPPQIAAACAAVEDFLQKHTPDQQRWFFSITFPTLICRIFGFDESSSAPKLQAPNGWVDVAIQSGDTELAGKIFNLLTPGGVLLSSISAVDKLSLIKYVFPVERLPEWIRYMIQNKRDYGVLVDMCPLLKNRITEDSPKGSCFQVQLNVFEYFLFWFVYYPVCRGNTEGLDTSRVQRSRKSRLENWASTLPGLYSSKQGKEQKNEGNLYIRLLYAYLRAFLPMHDLNAHQPYRSSLLHHSWGYDSSVLERAEFFINSLINFWLVDNDFSPVPVSMCKSLGINLPFRSLFGETPPTSGLGEVINVFVRYVVLGSVACREEHDKVEFNGSPQREFFGSADSIDLREAALGKYSWNTWIQRPLYRFILRTFLFCPVQSSVKNVYQVFSVWVNYIEPWNISLQEFADLDPKMGRPDENTAGESPGYSPSWQSYVLANYLYYSSLVMHFLGFAHKFLLTDPEVIIKMVSKVISILTMSPELVGLLKNMDTVYHSKHTGSSKSKLNALHKFVPVIREHLQDWESGLCESNADGSFLHDNWNKDLRLFSEDDDGGQQLLKVLVLLVTYHSCIHLLRELSCATYCSSFC
ncbi:OLC1v1031741C1 [Oldenlandia corymbosa var. corymbosa]|uniref:OLC1v1031741C1 n=1 Tax=Oldenlandia corymbosa var. corymbosa TaxID=529605 RepID=A0AAV1CM36_OLDCO|nr:OLC1v1031741C1 [Oldenlandia corymbosa var. corymbosa]